jgi:hypothetical protein
LKDLVVFNGAGKQDNNNKWVKTLLRKSVVYDITYRYVVRLI